MRIELGSQLLFVGQVDLVSTNFLRAQDVLVICRSAAQTARPVARRRLACAATDSAPACLRSFVAERDVMESSFDEMEFAASSLFHAFAMVVRWEGVARANPHSRRSWNTALRFSPTRLMWPFSLCGQKGPTVALSLAFARRVRHISGIDQRLLRNANSERSSFQFLRCRRRRWSVSQAASALVFTSRSISA